MRVWLAVLVLGCGGDAFDIPDVQDVQQSFRPDKVKNWCCEGERFGVPVLGCGFETIPNEFATCYCAGVVTTDTGECYDPKTFTRGTLCTSSDLVCW